MRAVSYDRKDFVEPIRPINKWLAGIVAGLDIAGIGMIRWEFWDKEGKPFIVEAEGYYVPDCRVKLLSPQQYLRAMNGNWLIVDKDGTTCEGVDRQVLNLNLSFANPPFARAYSLSTKAELDSAYHACPTIQTTSISTTMRSSFYIGITNLDIVALVCFSGYCQPTSLALSPRTL